MGTVLFDLAHFASFEVHMLRRGFLVGCAAAAPLSSSAAGAIATHARRPLLVNVDFVSDTM